MKKYLIITIILFATLISSCASFLEEDPKNSILQDGFFESEDDVETALYSLYSPLISGALFGRFLPAIELGTDLYTTRKSSGDGDVFREFTVNPESPWINGSGYGTWAKLWQGVVRCNYIINSLDDVDITDSYRTQAIAEARCMRAFYYYFLVRLWGDLPIITWYTTSGEFEATSEMPRSSADNVYNYLIVPDLLEAAENAPSEYSSIMGGGRATKWLARTMLAEVYMTMAGYRRDSKTGVIDNGDPIYWSMALEMIKTVVNVSDFSPAAGCPFYLLSDYGQNWDEDFSNEGMLEAGAASYSGAGSLLAQEILPQLGGGEFWSSSSDYWDLTRVYNGTSYNTSTEYIYPYYDSDGEAIEYLDYHKFPTGARANGLFVPTAALFHKFETGDYRKEWGLATSYTDADNTYYFTPAFRKYLDFDLLTGQSGTDWSYSDVNFIIYRYADALMILAEAENEVNGATATAQGAINAIRNRAGLGNTAATSQADMREAIQQERAVEFHGELKHRFDLIRWNTFREVTKSYDHYYTAGVNASTPREGVPDDNENFNYVEGLTEPSKKNKSYIKNEDTVIFSDIKDFISDGCETNTQAPEYFYLLPIPQGEIDKTSWSQNIGY